jgi:glycosyltransferase involved in cell wall biosynthesis
MNIAHICYSFSPLSETFIYDIIDAQVQQGHDPHVISFQRENNKERPFPEEQISQLKLPVWDLRRYWNRISASGSEGEKQTANWHLYRQKLKEKLTQIKPDVIHAHFGTMGVLAYPVANEMGIPIVVSFYGYDISQLLQSSYWVEEYNKAVPNFDGAIGISNHICNKISRFSEGSDDVHLLHLGVDLEKFPPSSQLSSENQQVQCLFVGRFVEKKSPMSLVKSFHEAQKKLADLDIELKLWMAGGGPLMDQTKQLVQELNLTDDIDVKGALPHDEVIELFKQADIYTQHSVTASNGDEEGQGVTFVEASAMELPIVATRHNGIPDVVLDGETGFLVEEHDTEAMGQKIAELAEHPQQWEALGKAGRKHIEKEFDKEKQSKKLIEIYREVC